MPTHRTPSEDLIHRQAEQFAYIVSKIGGRAGLIDRDNNYDGRTSIADAIERGCAFFVHVRPGLMAFDFDGPFASIDAELLIERLEHFGTAPVLVRSGQGDHRHVLAVATDPNAANHARRWLRHNFTGTHRVDDRGASAIRPPMTPHRQGGRSEVLYPDSVADALNRLSPYPNALPLSKLRLIHRGDTDGVYQSRSEADAAVAAALVFAGAAESDLQAVLSDPKAGVGAKYRGKDPGAAQGYLKVTWANAVQFAGRNSTRQTQRRSQEEQRCVEQFRKEVLDAMWSGMTTKEWKSFGLLLLLADLGERIGSTTVGMSVRAAAEHLVVSKSAAQRYFGHLADLGWIECANPGVGEKASEWKLITARCESDDSGTLSQPLSGGGGVNIYECPSSEVFALSSPSLVGSMPMQCYVRLTDTPLEAHDLGRLINRSTHSVSKYVKQLETFGLASREANGWIRGPVSVRSVSERLNVGALRGALRTQHDQDRRLYGTGEA